MLEVDLTIPVKLSIPRERQEDVQDTIQQFQHAVNYTIDNAKENGEEYYPTTKKGLHDAVYHDLRDQTNLPANLCVRAYSQAGDMLKSTIADWKKGTCRELPVFSKETVIYDKRTLTIKDRSATLATVNGRVPVDFEIGSYQRDYLDDDEYEKRMRTLHYDAHDDEYYLHIVLKREVEERDGDRVLGVDFNLKNVAVTSTGTFFDGGRLNWLQNHFHRVKSSLQHKGTRSATQALKRLSGRENRSVLNRLHMISKNVVQEAVEYDCSIIAVEDLTEIRESMKSWNSRIQRQMHSWGFRKLRDFIEYKAALEGIRFEAVDPHYTSQSCSRCGHQESSNRKSSGWFECQECGYEVDGDYNAAKNIGLRVVDSVPDDKCSSGLGNRCQLALKSGTLNVNRRYSSYGTLPSEQESHAQAHAFRRG